jgi:signal transduction histidine kinase/ligand-binding sensor domain-containing protein
MSLRERARRLLLIALRSAACLGMAAGPPARAEARFEHLGPEEGLPHGTINDLLQDRSGFLWLATSDGLARYDGIDLRVFRFTPDDVAAGASNRFFALLEDRDGGLWTSTSTGVYRFDRSAARFVETPSPSAGESQRRSPLLLDADGALWSGRAARGIERLDPTTGRFLAVPLPEDERGWVADLSAAPDGTAWVLLTEVDWTQPRAYRLSGGGVSTGPAVPIPGIERAFRLRFDREGSAWVYGSQRETEAGPVRLRPVDGLPDEPLQAFLEASDGRKWFGTGVGLYVVEPGERKAREVPLADDPHDWQGRNVLSLAEDDAGIVWAGTLAGVSFADPHRKPFRHLASRRGDAGGLPARAVSAVALDGDGGAWVGTYGGGLAYVDLGRGRVVETRRNREGDRGSLCDDLVWSLLLDARGDLWVGTESGLCVASAGARRFRRVDLPLPLPRRPGVHRVKDLALADGALWVGTNLGLVRLDLDGGDSRSWGAGQGPEGLSFTSIGALLVDPAGGGLFVGTTGGGLDRLSFATGDFAHIATGQSASSRDRDVAIYDLEPASSGGLWIASSDGLGRWLPGRQRAEFPVIRVELPGSTVFSVVEDARGLVWLGTNRGLVRFDPRTEAVRVFDLGDGVGSVEFNRHAAARDARGALVFGGMDGLTLFEPESVRESPYRPPTALTRAAVLGATGERSLEPHGLARLVLGPEDRAVTFDWAVLFFSRPDRCVSRYRLEGLDGDWIDAGTSRRVRYTNLEPGDYRFRVVSANADGLWSDRAAELAVRVLPPFWRTAWFRLLVVTLVAGLLALAYRLRLARLQALERMRLRIAGDLHDELGGDLSGIAVTAGLVAGREQLAAADRDRLAGVERTAVEVMHGLRDIVWCVDPSRDRLVDLAERLRAVARALFEQTDVEIEHALASEAATLPMDLRRALYLSAKELLHNVARHSRARRVRVALGRVEGALRLEVVDDGIGFPPQSSTDGTGLASVRRRLAEVGGTVEVASRPGEGARVRLEVPFP